jgi:pyridoxal phosphate enzyme (YggS family)
MSVADNIKKLHARIAETCARSGRNPAEIELVAVTKRVDMARIEQAVESGVRILGENKVQEAWQKYRQSALNVRWHMIGHLQTNKVKRVLQFADMIQSVDSLRLAQEIDLQAQRLAKTVDILIQVNTSGESSKFGLSPDDTDRTIGAISELPNVRIRGMMTIATFTSDKSLVRSCFRSLREIRDKIAQKNYSRVDMRELSMGMTDDFEFAIEEGGTILRIGRLIFGERVY